MNLDLSGKKALVTGSTLGIGRAIAEALLKEGVSLIINGRFPLIRIYPVVEPLLQLVALLMIFLVSVLMVMTSWLFIQLQVGLQKEHVKEAEQLSLRFSPIVVRHTQLVMILQDIGLKMSGNHGH